MGQSILVVSRGSEIVSRFRSALLAVGMADVTLDCAPSAALALRILNGSRKEIGGIVVDLANRDEALSLLVELHTLDPHTPVYAVALDAAGRAASEAVAQLGYCRTFRQLPKLAALLAEEHAASKAPNAARLVLFAPAQEGSGASAAALHAASILVRDHGRRTLFAELDYHSDSVACRLRLASSKSLVDLAADEDWRGALAEWRGLHVLAAPTSARILRRRGLPDLRGVLDETGTDYDLVIGDLPCNTAVATPQVLSAAETIYVVATAEVTSLHLARRRILELGAVGANPKAIRLIINRDRPGAVDSELARQVTGLTPAHRLPNDYAASSEAETEGRTVDAGSALGLAYARLAAGILGKTAIAAASEPSGWSRLLAAWR